ncbi:MAG: LysE/ArgO family amino acid transporter [Moritella sp.]|uniref:LysE/ArgO family amino acid transporter n=1 Tax=Moritella sp. TaxID=78556 RepID=UPI0029B9E1F5|nr:LysE/ArgO family amino acid transporter [Moritella sp.]MDX2319254.1 LysE/ArgO family amino acid transporter [Moritella sp.]
MLTATIQGLLLGGSMIIPIGAQNAYILNQGIKRNHHFLTASICILCDGLLISAGVFGAGSLLALNPDLLQIITWGGIIFLTSYGAMSFHSAWQYQYAKAELDGGVKSRKMVVVATLAVTLLNPHVYLDTVVVLGSVGNQFSGDSRLAFAGGTILASILWFYGLAFSAAKFSNWLNQPQVQRTIDLLVGSIMWLIASSLYRSLA